MSTYPRIAAAALAALVLTAACNRPDDEATRVDTAAGTVVANDIAVTQIDIGKSIGADKRVADATDNFMATDTVYVAVATSGTAPSATLAARWTYEDGQVVDQSSETISPTGPAVTEFHISKPDGLPKGKYRVEVTLNGTPAGTKEFTVK
ncbi:MAG TPA: hypothetical protein VJ717_01790 [Gemmatimonadaceae bacterium]|nr:hypothetical protein [Gemmatimonadaceae bacterium]